MLRSEHLLYRFSGESVKPRFIDPQSPFLQEIAAELIGIFTPAPGSEMTRQELEEITASMIRSCADTKIASGLYKLLLDRSGFTSPAAIDYPQARRETFTRAAELIKSGSFTVESLQNLSAVPGIDLYGDLPDFEKLAYFDPVAPTALLHRYNLAQAQGLLFYAKSAVLKLNAPDPGELRKLLKTVKFFRLLAQITKVDKKRLSIEFSGPYAIFDASTKYALQLANLLPAIVKLPQWELCAEIKLKKRSGIMKLSHKNQLVSHYRQLSAYIPDEIRLFHHTFNDKQNLWQIIGDTPFIDGGNQELLFPDLSFRSAESGRVFHAELFHRWHAGQLPRRIKLLHEQPELPLILGIDRALVKNEEEFDQLFADAPEVKERCWLFRDFPGVTSTVNALKRAEKLFSN